MTRMVASRCGQASVAQAVPCRPQLGTRKHNTGRPPSIHQGGEYTPLNFAKQVGGERYATSDRFGITHVRCPSFYCVDRPGMECLDTKEQSSLRYVTRHGARALWEA